MFSGNAMPPTENQTSFIPRKPLSGDKKKKKKRLGSGGGFLFIGSLGILLITGAAAAGVYFYQQYLNSQLDAQQKNLERAVSAFEPEVILELQRFSDRITAAGQLTRSHTAFSQMFDTLNEHTLRTVRFTDLNLRETDGGFELILSGEAENYSSVALQSDAFGDVREFKNPIFSNITVAQDGRITFAVSTIIPKDAFTYRSLINQGAR